MFAGECLLVKRAKSNEWSRAREHRKFSPCQSGERTDERARARARIARPDCKFIAGNCFAARPPIVYGHGERVPIHSARARLVLKGPGQSAPIPATASSSAVFSGRICWPKTGVQLGPVSGAPAAPKGASRENSPTRSSRVSARPSRKSLRARFVTRSSGRRRRRRRRSFAEST